MAESGHSQFLFIVLMMITTLVPLYFTQEYDDDDKKICFVITWKGFQVICCYNIIFQNSMGSPQYYCLELAECSNIHALCRNVKVFHVSQQEVRYCGCGRYIIICSSSFPFIMGFKKLVNLALVVMTRTRGFTVHIFLSLTLYNILRVSGLDCSSWLNEKQSNKGYTSKVVNLK